MIKTIEQSHRKVQDDDNHFLALRLGGNLMVLGLPSRYSPLRVNQPQDLTMQSVEVVPRGRPSALMRSNVGAGPAIICWTRI